MAMSQPPNKEGDWHVVTKKGKKMIKKRKKGEEGEGTVNKPKLKRPTPARSGDAIRVSVRDGQSYADILKEMKAKERA